MIPKASKHSNSPRLAIMLAVTDLNYTLASRSLTTCSSKSLGSSTQPSSGSICRLTSPGWLSRMARHGQRSKTVRAVCGAASRSRLSAQKIYPAIQIKHMSRAAASIRFAATMRQLDGRGQRNRGVRTGHRRGHFVDVKTLANALLARGFTLATLSKFLAVPNSKLDHPDFDGAVDYDMIRYAVGDVQATWECYTELMLRYDRLGLTQTAPEKVTARRELARVTLHRWALSPGERCNPMFRPASSQRSWEATTVAEPRCGLGVKSDR